MDRICFPRIWLTLSLVLIHSASSTTLAAAPQRVFRVQIVADDMCCNGCAQRIAAQLYALPGVTGVQADVPKRLVTVTGKLSPKLTLERLWQAVEKGKGGPSKLITRAATYTFTQPENLAADERSGAGHYTLEVEMLQSNDRAQAIADQLYRIPGVQNVNVDMARRTLAIQATAGPVISPWTVMGAAERAQYRPISVAGPFGVFTIERAAADKSAATAQLVFPQNPPPNQGELR